jgi:hypothetical protein
MSEKKGNAMNGLTQCVRGLPVVKTDVPEGVINAARNELGPPCATLLMPLGQFDVPDPCPPDEPHDPRHAVRRSARLAA